MRKATLDRPVLERLHGISIPAFREEGDIDYIFSDRYADISIPAFREEGDK